MFTSPLLRADFGSFTPAMQLALVESAIAAIEVKDPSERSRIENDELPRLIDRRTHLDINIERTRQANPYIARGGLVPCPKCGHRFSVPKEGGK